MNITDVYGGDWLRAENLPKDRDVPVTISRVTMATMTDSRTKEEKQQLVLQFVGKEKQLGLNITNAHTIGALYGEQNVEEVWVGKKLHLYVTSVEAFGKMTDAIRIRDFDPTRVTPQAIRESVAPMPGDQFIVKEPPQPSPAVQQHVPIDEADIPF